MTHSPTSVSSTDTLAAAKALMDAEGIHRLPVVDQGKLIGILAERDIRTHWSQLESTEVGSAMTPNPVTVTPRTPIKHALELVLKHKFGGLPVVESGKLVGIITTTDLLKAFVEVLRSPQMRQPGC